MEHTHNIGQIKKKLIYTNECLNNCVNDINTN